MWECGIFSSANKTAPPWPAIRELIHADDTDPQALLPEDIVSTHWLPKEILISWKADQAPLPAN